MTRLTDQQKQLLFDYSLGLASDQEAAEAEKLLSRSEEAADLHRALQVNLAPLDSLEPQPCPDELTERLFLRLKEVAPARPEAKRLDALLAAERSGPRTIKIPLWRNWMEVVTAAAIIVLVVSVLFPSVGFMRYSYAKGRCGAQLAGLYEGLTNYASDHDGLRPMMAVAPGSPWWKVGYQGQENYSNTRRLWLLAKYGYVPPESFLCPGRQEPHKISYEGFKLRNLNDFPSPIYNHYSTSIPCPTSNTRDFQEKSVLLADRNPLAEMLPSDPAESCAIRLGEDLMTANSRNHKSRGQNALLSDGSVEFIKSRHTSISPDDIYVLRDMCCGTEIHGCEVPASTADIFLAP